MAMLNKEKYNKELDLGGPNSWTNLFDVSQIFSQGVVTHGDGYTTCLSVKNWEIAIKSRMWKRPLENQQAWECAKELERWVLNGHVGLSENRIPQIPVFIINFPIIWRSFWWYSLFSATPMWVNYDDLNATSLESWLTRGIIPKIALFQVSELL